LVGAGVTLRANKRWSIVVETAAGIRKWRHAAGYTTPPPQAGDTPDHERSDVGVSKLLYSFSVGVQMGLLGDG